MSYKILLRNNETQEERWHTEDGPDWDVEVSDFLWTEGNYACDCNRGTMFDRAGGEKDVPWDRYPCGAVKYTAVCVELPDGTRIPLDKP